MTNSTPNKFIHPNGQEIPLEGKMTIGRLDECHIQVMDKLASRLHAEIEATDGKVTLTDLNSNNGTWVNEQRVTAPVVLRSGDKIRIGETVFTFQTAGAPASAPVEKEPKAMQTMSWETKTLMALVRGSDGAEFGLSKVIKIGRDESNDIALKADASASQFHAQVELHDGSPIITDLNSSNGTWVNGKRITEKTPLKHGDKIRIGNTILRLRVADKPLPPLDPAAAPQKKSSSIWGWVTGLGFGTIAILFLCVFAILGVVLYRNNQTANAEPTPDVAAIKKQALRSLAFILTPDQNYRENSSYYTGSGSFIHPQGYVLTNFHVIGYTETQAQQAGKQTGEMKNMLYKGGPLILVGINWNSPVEEPDTFYRTEVVKSDPYLDLALLRIVELYNEKSDAYEPLPANTSFPFIKVGNSDELEILEPITIIGYPGVGGNSPTAIDDEVAGFSDDDMYNIKNGWIKTGPIISQGNSGGMAINQKGELIGVPTQIVFNQTDKIGYIRPIKLALSMIGDFLP